MNRRGCFAVAAVALFSGSTVALAQPASCSSTDPRDWPQPSKPYFLVLADTSSSMTADVTFASSCGAGNTRLAHLRCTLRNLLLAHSGQANFGLATFPVLQESCTSACSCTPTDMQCFPQCSYN
jgi:hypothetical protein